MRKRERKILDLLAPESERVLAEYRERPLEFFGEYGRLWPEVIERIFWDIYMLRVDRACLVGPRGGGKTMGVSSLGTALYLWAEFDVLFLGGSKTQAQKGYAYAAEILHGDERLEDFNVEELKTLTRAADGHWMKFATASTKAIRGEHAGDVHKRMGGRAHGGIVILDEEAEMDEDVVKAGLKTVRTARPPVIVRSSTLHRTEGTFGQLVDDPMGRGYRLYEWDTFDVSEMCRRSCKRCIPEFREKYCMGKAKKHRPGWVPIVNIIQDWEGRLSDEDFEVECMGWRPSSEGLVLDPVLVDGALSGEPRYLPGQPTAILVDWGFKGWTCKLVVQEQEDRAIAVVAAEYFHQRPDKEIYAACAEDREVFGAWEVYADASHPFQNQNLRDDGFAVEEVAFSQYKDLGVGWIRGLTERGQLGLPGEVKDGKYEYPAPAFRRLHQELKGWRRGRTGQIVKRDDHGPDALLCGAAKWAEAVPWSAEFVSAGRRVSADVDY